MNNQQFRNLLIGAPQKKDGSAGSPVSSRPSAQSALGSRKSTSIPMTPRQVGGRATASTDFARQLAERNARANPAAKFKSSAPKGVKLATGYIDRTKNRAADDDNETANRIQKLEEAMKLGQLDRDTFERLVQEITGGEIGTTHLVKGLDRKLLDRVRRGEDVREAKTDGLLAAHEEPEIEDEFDELADHDTAPVVRQKAEKKGELAPPPPVAGVKRSRNDILAELKAQRKAAAEAAAAEHEKKYPSLGPAFRKVGLGGETSRIERDAKGREVLIITGPDGKEKRKVRKQRPTETSVEPRYDIEDPNKPLQINQDSLPRSHEEPSDDEDIFAGVGFSYNPLASLEDGDDTDSSEEEEAVVGKKHAEPSSHSNVEKGTSASPNTSNNRGRTSPPAASAKSAEPRPHRNYFSDRPPEIKDKDEDTANAALFAALAKARQLDPESTLLQDTEEARLKKRATQLAASDRDLEDLDLGFGGSRFDDVDEMEQDGQKVKLSEWKGLGAEDEDNGGQEGRGGKKRKRGPKKKQGDKNSAADVLKVMERQKGTKTLG